MKQRILKLGIFLALVGILLRISYVNAFYPRTELEYLDRKKFLYEGLEIEIINAKTQSFEDGIIAEIECILSNRTKEDISIMKNNIGLINGGYYLYCDISEETQIKVKALEEVKTEFTFKIESEQWPIFQKAGLIFMDFERSYIKPDIFKEQE